MSRLVSIDGAIVSPDDAKVSVYDRGFLYGDSVFETIRTYGGAPFALDEHMARLERSADRVAIAMPVPRAVIAEEVRRAIAEAGNAESYARVMLTRGSGPLGLDPSLATRPLRVILIEPLKPLPASLYRDGVAVVTVRTERPADAAQGAKVGNYLASLLALRKAYDAGAHEALILNASGQVVEGTTSNVFAVRSGGAGSSSGPTLVTPPDEAGLLPGITRAHLLATAAELGIPVLYASLTPEETAASDEVFLSSSLREVLPVVRVDGMTVSDGRPGRVTRELHAAFRRRAGLGSEPMPWER
jgi:branched-chain amino acid aminotransferase